MTEQEWAASKDAAGMLLHLQGERPALLSQRKCRLLACAISRLYPRGGIQEEHDETSARAEAWADAGGGAPAVERDTDRCWYVMTPHAWLGLKWLAEWKGAGRDGPKALLVREVFGDPFRPVGPTGQRWGRDAVAYSLALAAYSERLENGALDPVRLSVLADALEDAGCLEAQILGHLRGPNTHVRGCWALDLILGKS